MPDQFTQRTRRIMVLAGDISRRHGLDSISDLAVLIALLEENNGVAASILLECGVELAPLYERLPKTQTDLRMQDLTKPIVVSSEVEQLLRSAESVAAEYEAPQVGTEHLLIAMLRAGEAITAAKLLAEHGLTEARAREIASTLL